MNAPVTSLTTIRYGRYVVNLGRLSAALYEAAPWAGDGYPAWQIYADELELLLGFAERRGALGTYWSELTGRASQRDSAIEELRVAFLLENAGFPVVAWRPTGAGSREGEFTVSTPDGGSVFVEVKSPGWEGQLSDADRAAGRLNEPKYRRTEAFFADNGPPLAYAVDKAYPKFADSTANLLVVSDDLRLPLAVETALWTHAALFGDGGKYFDSRYERLGGVGIVAKQQSHERVWCEMRVFLNPFARIELPQSIAAAFPSHASEE